MLDIPPVAGVSRAFITNIIIYEHLGIRYPHNTYIFRGRTNEKDYVT